MDTAIASGQIPAEFRHELDETALELQNGVNCPVEPEGEEGKKGEGEEHGHEGKGKKKGHEEDEVTTTGTTTEGE